MKPKKSKEFIPNVAAELDLPQHIVEAIIKMYWKEVWQNLTTLSSPKVHIENLGDFNFKHWLLEKELVKSSGRQKYVAGVGTKERKELLENIKLNIQEENQRKEFIYEHKKIIKDPSTSLEE